MIEAGVQYHLEKAEDEPGIELDLDKTLADINSVVLHAVRDNSKRAPLCGSGEMKEALNTSLQKFSVTWSKKWAKFEASLEVSKGGVYVCVTGGGSGGLLRPPHPVSYSSASIVCCNLKLPQVTVSSKKGASGSGAMMNKENLASTGFGNSSVGGPENSRVSNKKGGGSCKCEVLLTCRNEQKFKDYLFECEESIGQDIVDAIKAIKSGDLTSSTTAEEDKPRRRYSFAGLKKKNNPSRVSGVSNNRPPPH